MFICDFCKKQAKAKTRANRVVVKSREKFYEKKTQNGVRKVSSGSEIAKEIIICDDCFKNKA